VPAFPDPPRSVSLPLRVKLLFGGVDGHIGWFFLMLGSLCCWGFVPRIDWSTGGHDATATGVIDHVEPTRGSENGATIHAVHYHFDALDGTRVEGISFTTNVAALRTGGQVIVEFNLDDPSRSRIAGMRSKHFPIWTAIVLLFPLIGAWLAVRGMRNGARSLALLREGRLARGRLIHKEEPHRPSRVGGRPVLIMTFAFESDDGETHEVVAETHRPELLEDDADEKVLYHPADPSWASLVDHLPGRPRIARRRHLASGSRLPWVFYLALPAACLLLNIRFLRQLW
jgi:hypothetical protein